MPGRRRPAADPQVAARFGRLLPPPGVVGAVPGGWVPPPEEDAGWEAPVAPEPEPVVESAEQPDAERSWSPASSPSAGPGLLPGTLAGGRLDPGQRGAVALVLVCVLAALVAAAVVLRGRPQEVEVPVLEVAGTPLPGASAPAPTPTPSAPTELVVAVVGEVVSPGIVRLPAGSRVDDAVRAAGGLAPGGSPGLLNLARPLQDGEQVVVSADTGPDPPVDAPGAASSGGLVDLNRATVEQLDALPGIGPVLAERIVAWRTENGGFASVDQLREVPGIGEAKYATLKPEVTV